MRSSAQPLFPVLISHHRSQCLPRHMLLLYHLKKHKSTVWLCVCVKLRPCFCLHKEERDILYVASSVKGPFRLKWQGCKWYVGGFSGLRWHKRWEWTRGNVQLPWLLLYCTCQYSPLKHYLNYQPHPLTRVSAVASAVKMNVIVLYVAFLTILRSIFHKQINMCNKGITHFITGVH